MEIKFIIYGLVGWGLEILWTGMGSALRGSLILEATTYLWMFPIYGLAVFLEPLHDAIRGYYWYLRGLIWLLIIWSLEYATGGTILLLIGEIPWDYSLKTEWQLAGLIRLDMGPVWFGVGLLFERLHDGLDQLLKL